MRTLRQHHSLYNLQRTCQPVVSILLLLDQSLGHCEYTSCNFCIEPLLTCFHQIRQFHVKQRNRMYVVEQREKERLAHLRGVMEEQAREDRER